LQLSAGEVFSVPNISQISYKIAHKIPIAGDKQDKVHDWRSFRNWEFEDSDAFTLVDISVNNISLDTGLYMS
jgi:hypothetical protein